MGAVLAGGLFGPLPARLVTGYRVFEWNEAGGYYMVRSRDAHAWVEVFMEGQWTLVEATPPGSLRGEAAKASAFTEYVDVIKRFLGQIFDKLANLSVIEVLGALVLVVVLLLVFRRLRRRSKTATVALEKLSVYPALVQLEAALARARAAALE